MTKCQTKPAKADAEDTGALTRSDDHPVFAPATHIYAGDDEFVLVAEMPGVAQEDLEVTVEKDVLSLRGRTRSEDVAGHELLYRDYQSGVYERSFTVSSEIDVENIKAELKNGVLRLVLPKVPKAQPKRIPVQLAG